MRGQLVPIQVGRRLLHSVLDVVVPILLLGRLLVELGRVLLGDRVVPAVPERPDEVVVLGVDLDLARRRRRHDQRREPRRGLFALGSRSVASCDDGAA